ncbi:MAG: hypothetical protein ABW022_07130 [Actinoplanes sp.]
MTPARSLAASVVALGFASTLTAPTPALAAPAPCERAENYAAQSGAEVLRIEKLEVRTVGAERPTTKDQPEGSEPAVTGATERILGTGEDPTVDDSSDSDTISEGVTRTGEAVLGVLGLKSADTDEADGDATGGTGGASAESRGTGGTGGGGVMTRRDDERRTITGLSVGEARTAMIGSARIKSAAVARVVNGKGELAKPLMQQAPPSHEQPAKRSTRAGKVGPAKIGSGEIGAHARWEAGMACGSSAGEAARSDATLSSMNLLNGSLVRVAGQISGSSTTGLERHGDEARTVAAATAGTGRIELAGGRVQIRVLRAPTLVAGMSATKRGDVRYQPAVIEVSGGDLSSKRLDAVGEHVDITLRPDRRAMESVPLSGLAGVGKAARLPLPAIPGLPEVAEPSTESAPTGGPGTWVRVSLGDVRQATKGHAIAARATAIKVAVSQGEATTGGRGKPGYGDKPRTAVSLALGVGLLEAAAVAPEKKPAGVSPAVAGAGGGLPITGPRLDLLAYGGAGLLAVGIVAVLATMRRRRPRS